MCYSYSAFRWCNLSSFSFGNRSLRTHTHTHTHTQDPADQRSLVLCPETWWKNMSETKRWEQRCCHCWDHIYWFSDSQTQSSVALQCWTIVNTLIFFLEQYNHSLDINCVCVCVCVLLAMGMTMYETMTVGSPKWFWKSIVDYQTLYICIDLFYLISVIPILCWSLE